MDVKCTKNHETQTCQVNENNYVCAVCPDNAKHASIDKNCPTYTYQKQVCEIMSTQSISFIEAKKQVTPMSRTYASAAKNKNCTCICTCQNKPTPEVTHTHTPTAQAETPHVPEEVNK